MSGEIDGVVCISVTQAGFSLARVGAGMFRGPEQASRKTNVRPGTCHEHDIVTGRKFSQSKARVFLFAFNSCAGPL